MAEHAGKVESHYSKSDLTERILELLAEAGADLEALTLEELAPVDEMHVRGRQATAELAERAGFSGGMRVLDVGCGMGGPTRFLAKTSGCRVVAIDLTEDLLRTAAELARRSGLGDRIEYRQADALALPFEDAGFDGAWSQHVQMNIADKAGLYGEIARVLKPGARLAVYDILGGPAGPPHYPCPWAREPAISFLAEPEAWRAQVEASGFELESWRDTSELGRAWFVEMSEKAKADPETQFGRARIMGPDFIERIGNLRRSLEEDRVVLIEAIWRRV